MAAWPGGAVRTGGIRMKPVFASIFSGGGLVEAGIRDLVDLAFAVEHDPQIADVYRMNFGDHVIVSAAQAVDFTHYTGIDILWASTECQEFGGKRNKYEDKEQISQAEAVCRALRDLRPRAFILENVPGYRQSESIKRIGATLLQLDYAVDQQILNAADYGVPQTRERFILRAIAGGWMQSTPDIPGRSFIRRGWWQAVADLIPSLPDAHFARWQREHLRTSLESPFVLDDQRSGGSGATLRAHCAPIFTITTRPAGKIRAWTGDRVVKFIPRCYARFQSVPDWYQLPDKNSLACTVIGNGVPSLLARRIVESVL